MSRRLFESLRAVGLQHHYDRLSSVGVRSLAHLTVLTLDDFPLLGIRTMEDRTCLFRLVQQLRTLDPQTLLQAGAEEETSYPQRMHQTGAEEDSHSATPNSQQCDNKTWNNMSSVCRQLDFSSETASEPPTGNTEESFGNSAANNNFRKDCGKLKSLLEKQVIKNVMKDYTDMKPKQNSKKSSRRKPNKPTLDTENVRTLVYQSSPSECNYGLPQTRSLPTPSKRRSGEPRIWVCVRKRPLTPAEEKRQETDVVTSSGQSCVVQESRAAVDLTHYELQHKFYFDYVFGEDCSNEEVYQRTASPLVQHMLRGGSATCFAYGQTGAGKTHTMLGSSSAGCRGRCSGQGGTGSGEEPGLYALAAQDLFSYLSSSPTLSVFVSFFEIYCGQLYDLLDHRKRLFAREDGQRNVHIAGMCYRRVESVQSLLQVISRGTEERSQGCSGVNPVSSRSHALLQIQLRGAGPRGAEMWFVDLAGSERASDSRDSDRRSRMEGAEINQSLLALKECIRSLDQEQGHTPFRQSKLTQVLKDSFVGDSLTCMIANVSPGHCSTEHTLNTLRYADRVKELKGQSGQHTARRSKNPPCPKQHLSQSNGASRGRYRGLSPPKKPRTTSIVPPTPSAIRMHEDSAFLCSTPKNHQHNQDSRGRCDWISPVQSRPRVRREESEYREAKLWNQASSQQQNHEFGPRKIENEPSQSQRSHKWNDLSRYFEDQEKRRHLKLYHQQLQQFDPLLTSSGLLCQNTSTNSPKANSHAMESMLTSSVAMEDILGRFEARINQVQPCVSSSEAGLWLNNRKSGNFKYLVDETGVILRENRTGNNRRTKNVENREVKCAWISENEDVSGNCLSLGDNIKNCTTRRGFPVEFCDPRAPAERPLSPAAENSNSLFNTFRSGLL
ncbi:hypothetical protein NQD34_001348 [Periophthalmus magnuspinnatus]|nr:hypothetical protein NQD34_001348 [Periophthalmus magnuspinnatus]